MSDEERRVLQEAAKEEEKRFAMYKRAWYLRNRKAKSICAYSVEEKNDFILDWDEMVLEK